MKFIISLNGVSVDLSAGKTKSGEQVYFVKPSFKCWNRSWRCVGEKHRDYVIRKWFSPGVKRYAIRDRIIGSNSVEHAIKEYYRVCARKDIGTVIKVEVVEINEQI